MGEFDFTYKSESFKVSMSFEEERLEHVVERIEEFLRAVGFHFDGALDIVEENYCDQTVTDQES